MHIGHRVVKAFPLKIRAGKFVSCILYRTVIGEGFMCYVENTGFKSHWYTHPYDAVAEVLSTFRAS